MEWKRYGDRGECNEREIVMDNFVRDRLQGRSLLEFCDELKAEPCISDVMRAAIRDWSRMYTNEPEWKRGEVKSVNLASGICKEFARLVTLEFKSKCEDESVDKIYREQVTEKLRGMVEKACAKGGIVIKPMIDMRHDIKVEVIGAENFVPLALDSDGNVTECLLGAFSQVGKDYYTKVEQHRYSEDGRYTIRTRVYKSAARESLGKVIRYKDYPGVWRGIIEDITIEGVAKPLFTYFKMPFGNTVDESSTLGISVFEPAWELIRDADEQYSSQRWEYKGGELAVYADTECLEEYEEDENGNVRTALPSHTRRLIRKYSGAGIDQSNFYEVFAPQLRDESYRKGYDDILRMIEFNCQLAYGTLSNVQNTDKTAEEIRASKQRSYSAVLDIQNALEAALRDVIEVIEFWLAFAEDREVKEHSTSFEFDDSLACDRTQEFKERMEMTKAGYSAPWEFRKWYYGEDEETAKKMISEIELI